MHPILRNILAVIVGWLIGSAINMGLIQIGHQIYPLEGVDINDMDALASVMPTLSYEYFIFPFLAHALGTLVGAFVAATIAANNKMKFAIAIGCFFLIGGIINVVMLPSPTWFAILDIVGAYIPMAMIGGKLAIRKK